MKYAVEMYSNAVIYIAGFIRIGSIIDWVGEGYVDTQQVQMCLI
jgi:hypothetical protein